MEQTENAKKTPKRSDGKAKTYQRQALLGWVFSFAVAAAVVWFLFFVWMTPVKISGASMEPGILNGEVVLIDRLAKYFKEPGRGDVVLIEHDGELLVKRIVALGSETVEIVGGEVYIDSRPLEELGYTVNAVGDLSPTYVPDGSVFLLGDNRAVLRDSRNAEIGPVSLDDVAGVLRFRIYPMEKVTFYY